MNENVETLIFCGVAFAIGMGTGQFLSFRRKGRHKVTLELEAKELWQTIAKQTAWIIVIVMFFASILQSVVFTYTQRQCNEEVIETIKYRAGLSTENSKLNDARAEELRNLVDEITEAQLLPAGEDRARGVREAFATYTVNVDRLDKQKAENAQRRQDRPYPEC